MSKPTKINLCSMPVNLHRAIGYPGSADWLGLYWTPYGDELAWYDGITEFVGANYWAFFEWRKAVFDKLIPNIIWMTVLGSSDYEALLHFVLDIKNQDVYLMPVNTARQWIHNHRPTISIFEASITHAIAGVDEFQTMAEDIVNGGIQPTTILSSAAPCRDCQSMSGYIYSSKINRFDLCGGCGGTGWRKHDEPRHTE